MMKVKEIDAAAFAAKLNESAAPFVVDFGAPWCPPCRAIAPTLESLAGEYEDRLSIVSVNVDEAPELSARYGIKGLPTLVVFHRGSEVGRVIGAVPRIKLQQAFDVALAAASAVH